MAPLTVVVLLQVWTSVHQWLLLLVLAAVLLPEMLSGHLTGILARMLYRMEARVEWRLLRLMARALVHLLSVLLARMWTDAGRLLEILVVIVLRWIGDGAEWAGQRGGGNRLR